MNRHTLTIVATLGIMSSGVITNATALAGQSPDARDANVAARTALATQSIDLRSPDARDATVRSVRPPAPVYSRTDARSPDTRDVADGVRFVTVPAPTVIE